MKTLTLIIFFFVGLSVAKSQTLPIDTLEYRISVTSKVKDVLATVSISSGKQIALADFFQNEETSISAAVNNNTSSSTLQQLKDQLVAQFQSILSSDELAAFRSKRKDSIYAKVISGTN
ncbi:hypothetical protein [Mucilaginibacter sp. UYNi724]